MHTVDFTLTFTAVAPGDARVSLLRADAGVGASPRVWSGAHAFEAAAVADEVAALDRALRRAVQRGRGADALAAHGRLLFDLLLPSAAKAALRAEGGGALTIIADGVAVPWSALHDGVAFLAHRWALGELSPGADAPVPPPPMGADRLLVVADPAGDLPAARYEGEALVRDLAGGAGGLPCDLRLGSLRRADFLRIFKSFRLVHFAGHADPPDADGPAGWRLADGRLDADALRTLGGGAAPSLVFANACRSAAAFSSAMGAALHAAGVRHFVGTRVDLPDLPGADFAGRFYEALRSGVAVGEALRAASVASAEAGTSVWAAYRLVGDPRTVYFRARAAERFAPGVRRAVVVAVRRPPPVAPPDLLAEQLEAWRASLRDRVAAHGGRLLPGRGAVDRAVFGLPVSYENDLARAARAALAALAAAGPEAVVTLDAGPLASTGADVLGAPAQQAEAACWRLPSGVWALPAAVGRLEAAELTDAVEGARRLVGLTEREAVAEPPLVGRRAEMARLEALADEVTARGVPRAVTLVAPAGMGKSRLVSALLARLADRFTVLRGASIPYDEVSPFAAAGGVLLDLVDAFGPDDGPLDGRLTATLDALDDGPPGADEPLDAVLSIDDLLAADSGQPGLRERRGVLAPLLGLAGDDRAGEAGLVPDVFRQVIEAAARRHPVAVVFEDLHWLPDAGLAVVDELANGLRGAPVLLVCTARSELLDRAPHVFDAPSHVRLDLGPLSTREAEAVLRQALPAAVDAETVAALSSRAEGNPLFLRELALARAAGEVDAPPATVEAVMRARLDRLPPFEQEVLRAAAVLGRTFWREGVDRLLGGIDGLDGALRALERGRFVVQQAQSDLPGQTQWRFAHALLHEVVAHGVGTRARTAWHGRAALWLTDEVPDAGKADRWARVATHRAAAEDHARAAEAWLLAGARAAETLAPVEARRALEAALAADDAAGGHLGDARRAEAACDLAELASSAGDLDAAAAHLDAALTLSAAAPVADRAERLRRRAEVDEARGDLSAARARLAQARALVSGRDEAAARVVGITVRRDEAWLWYRDGQYDTAIARLSELLDAVAPDEHALMGLVRNALGVVSYGRGDYETAALHYRRALAAKEAVGDEAGAASACNNLGILAQKQGDVRAAVRWYQRAQRSFVKRGDRAGLARAYNNLGALYGELGAYDKAAKYLEESIRIRSRAGHGGVALGYANLGEVRLKQGRLDEARAHLEKAIALCREGRGPGYLLPDAWRMLAELHLQLDDAPAAAEAAGEALALARDSGDRPREGVALRVLGEACDLAGESAAAGLQIDEAIEVLEALEQPLELGRAYAARARHLERLGDAAAATAQARADALLAAVRDG